MEPESRERLIREAKRKELVRGGRRARVNIPIGGVVVGFGAALAYFAVEHAIVGPILSIFIAGFGLVLVPVGLAIVARALITIGVARRQVRELDALAIPAARIVHRG